MESSDYSHDPRLGCWTEGCDVQEDEGIKGPRVSSDLIKERLHNRRGENEHSGGRPEFQMGRV